MKYMTNYPLQKEVNEECVVELSHSKERGYDVLVKKKDKVLIEEWEPDSDWAYLTAKYLSIRFNINVKNNTK